MLRIEVLSRRFGGLTALEGVDLEVAEGEIYGVIGPNGSGKTTLFNVITGLYPATEGRVLLAGHDITRLPPYQSARLGIARTFQTPRIYARMTVMENTQAPRRALRHKGPDPVPELLESAGLAPRADDLAKNLPLPDQRRLELVRALAASPRVVLLDEPAGGMTPAETAEMAELIRNLAAPGRTVVVVEHKMDMITKLCSRLCVLNFGRKIAEGRPGEVLEDPAVIAAYIGKDDDA